MSPFHHAANGYGWRFSFSVTAVLAVLFALAPLAQGDASPSLGIASNQGFCVDGLWHGTKWPGGARPEGLSMWGSFCGAGNDNLGHIETQPFLAPQNVNLFVTGFPGMPGRRLILKNVESGEESELVPQPQPGDDCRFYSLPVPAGWVGKRVRLIGDDQATGSFGWLGFSLPILPASSLPAGVIDTNASPSGFCPEGVYGGTKWPPGGRPKDLKTWGSYCANRDADTGWGGSAPINARANFSVYIAGYPDTTGLSLAAENIQTGQQIKLRVPRPPAESWQRYEFQLPAEWKGQFVRVVGRDQATGVGGWVGFSDPLPLTVAQRFMAVLVRAAIACVLALFLLLPVAVVCLLPAARRAGNVTVPAILTLAASFVVYYCSRFWSDADAVISIGGSALAAGALIAWLRSGWRLPIPEIRPPGSTERIAEARRRKQRFTAIPRERISNLTGKQKQWILVLVWVFSAIAILPAIFHWTAAPSYAGFALDLRKGIGYLAAAAICYGIYRAEARRLGVSYALGLVSMVFVLTSVVNNLHNYMVDDAASSPKEAINSVWQSDLQDSVIRLDPAITSHAYRFLPNAMVRWMQMAHMDYVSARDIYRLLAGLLLFYAIYKFASLYGNYTVAILSMLFSAVIYPISFEGGYKGQLTDPLSHLSFVLALIFLETEEFAFLFTTLLIGSLAKETVLALAGYYVLFHRGEKGYPAKAAALCAASVAMYFGVRFYVLHGMMNYDQTSGVGLDHLGENWNRPGWVVLFLLTACVLLPLLALGWKETAVSLKRQVAYLLPVLFVSNLFFSWMSEVRNFMPLVFVTSVIAAGYFSRLSMGTAEANVPAAAERNEAPVR